MLSMGAGTGCDTQYLFAESVLGSNRGHFPRHAPEDRSRRKLGKIQTAHLGSIVPYRHVSRQLERG
jgi:3-methyl-2-oxobutanoate hydroxymethyltransferase